MKVLVYVDTFEDTDVEFIGFIDQETTIIESDEIKKMIEESMKKFGYDDEDEYTVEKGLYKWCIEIDDRMDESVEIGFYTIIGDGD